MPGIGPQPLSVAGFIYGLKMGDLKDWKCPLIMQSRYQSSSRLSPRGPICRAPGPWLDWVLHHGWAGMPGSPPPAPGCCPGKDFLSGAGSPQCACYCQFTVAGCGAIARCLASAWNRCPVLAAASNHQLQHAACIWPQSIHGHHITLSIPPAGFPGLSGP